VDVRHGEGTIRMALFGLLEREEDRKAMYSSAGKSSIENLHVGWAFDGVTANWSAERKEDNVRRHRIIVEMLERMVF